MRRIGLGVIAIALVCGVAHAAADYTIEHDRIYGHKAAMALTMDVVRPAEPNGVGLMYVVSRGWVSNYFDLDQAMADSARSGGRFHTLVSKGYTLFMVRHGSSPYFTVPDMASDLHRAVRFIRHHADEFGIDPNRIGAFGNSAGGHLALLLATAGGPGDADADDPVERESSAVQAVVAYFPPTDLRGIAGSADLSPALDFPAEQAADYSPVALVNEGDAPVLLVHGDKDDTVPLAASEMLREAYEKADLPAELIVIEGAKHGFYGRNANVAAEALEAWFAQHLLDED